MSFFRHYISRSKLLFAVHLVFIFLVTFIIAAKQAGLGDGAPISAVSALGLVILPAILVPLVTIALGCHRPEVRASILVLFERLCIAGIIGCGAIVLVQELLLGEAPAVSAVALAVFGGCAAVVLAHYASGRTLWFRRNLRCRTLVLGCGRKAQSIAHLAARDDFDLELVGFADVASDPSQGDRIGSGEERALAPVLPMPASILAYAHTHGIGEIVVALDDEPARLPIDQLIACRLGGLAVTDCGAFIERESRRIDLDGNDLSWLIFEHGFDRRRIQGAIKRVEDLVIGAGLLLFFAPLIPIIAALIKLDTPGPVFYRQERVGRHGRFFSILKFRSMRCDAEADGRPRWADRNDTRVTAVGRFLRATRLDEVPQLINVLRGDMSLVGPRPERPGFAAELAQQIPFYNERHRLRPGLTGWAQINYSYGASVADAREKLKYDLYYLKNWSLFLDFLVLLQTGRILLFREGAR